MVRFGNVLGSSGSVIPKFQEQINNGGPVTVTHKEITRFFMTIPEAAQLVLQASSMSKDKHIFILDMGSPIKIIDLAFKMIHLKGLKPYLDGSSKPFDGGIPILITGLRPGEKLYEELLLGKNSIKTTHPKIYMEILTGLETKELKILTQTLLNACNANDISTIKNIFCHPEINLTHSGEIMDLTI
jgi:FlaA1/EpsC-like NDP-sugar epimerase